MTQPNNPKEGKVRYSTIEQSFDEVENVGLVTLASFNPAMLRGGGASFGEEVSLKTQASIDPEETRGAPPVDKDGIGLVTLASFDPKDMRGAMEFQNTEAKEEAKEEAEEPGAVRLQTLASFKLPPGAQEQAQELFEQSKEQTQEQSKDAQVQFEDDGKSTLISPILPASMLQQGHTEVEEVGLQTLASLQPIGMPSEVPNDKNKANTLSSEKKEAPLNAKINLTEGAVKEDESKVMMFLGFAILLVGGAILYMLLF